MIDVLMNHIYLTHTYIDLWFGSFFSKQKVGSVLCSVMYYLALSQVGGDVLHFFREVADTCVEDHAKNG